MVSPSSVLEISIRYVRLKITVFQIPISRGNNYDGLVSLYLWEKTSFVELTEIMRQTDDQKVALALNIFSNCCLNEDDIIYY